MGKIRTQNSTAATAMMRSTNSKKRGDTRQMYGVTGKSAATGLLASGI